MNPQMNPQGFGSPFDSSTNQGFIAAEPQNAQLAFIRKTYVLLLAAIFTAVAMGAFTLKTPLFSLSVALISQPLLAFGLVLGACFAAQYLVRMPGMAYPALFGWALLEGFLLAPILAFYAPQAVSQAAVLTVILFGALTAYVFITRQNFNFLGGIAFIGMVGVIAAAALMLVVPAFRSSAISYWIAWAVLFFSSCFVLYDTSRMLHEHRQGEEAAAALGLFISFFNIFTAILRILGGRD